jgi:uncharacterized repeat protein (TIGR01451 family)
VTVPHKRCDCERGKEKIPMKLRLVLTRVGRFWLPLVAAGVLGAALLLSTPTWAAPEYQTVPLPTPTDEPAQPPTATPTRDANNDDDADDSGGSGGSGGGSGGGGAVQPDDIPAELTAIINAVRLNVRGGPGTSFDVVGTVTSGTQVTLIARDDRGTWWLVCCAANGEQGWVSAQFLDANGLSRAEANSLLPIASADDGTDGEAAATGTPTPQPAQDDTTAAPTLGLTLAVEQSPARVRQGGTVTLDYALTNPGNEAAVNVMLRSEVPVGLTLVDVIAAEAEEAETVIEPGRSAVLLVWSDVGAGASVTARVTYTIDEDVPNGAVIDVIAATEADNAELTSAGTSIGMPPALLPTFQ